MKNGKATSVPSMGPKDRKQPMQNASAPAMGGRNLSKSPMHPVSAPAAGVNDGWNHAETIHEAEGHPRSSIAGSEPVKEAKSTHGSKQTDIARAMWREGVASGHDAHGDAAVPVKHTGTDSLHKENPAVQTKARADHFRRIGGGANAHGENTKLNQHNNQ